MEANAVFAGIDNVRRRLNRWNGSGHKPGSGAAVVSGLVIR